MVYQRVLVGKPRDSIVRLRVFISLLIEGTLWTLIPVLADLTTNEWIVRAIILVVEVEEDLIVTAQGAQTVGILTVVVDVGLIVFRCQVGQGHIRQTMVGTVRQDREGDRQYAIATP